MPFGPRHAAGSETRMIEAITTSLVTIWIIVGGMVLFLFIAAASDNCWTAFWSMAIGLALLQFASSADPWGFVAEHRFAAAISAIAYLPLGVGWSLFRWWKTLQRAAVQLKAEKPKWEPDMAYKTWETYVDRRMPSPSQNKERIVCWIAYWPFSIAAYLLIDFLREVCDWIYVKISGMYRAMADRVKASLLN